MQIEFWPDAQGSFVSQRSLTSEIGIYTSREQAENNLLHLARPWPLSRSFATGRRPTYEGALVLNGWIETPKSVARARLTAPEASALLREKFVHDFAMHIRQAKITALKTIGEFRVIKAEQLQQRRV